MVASFPGLRARSSLAACIDNRATNTLRFARVLPIFLHGCEIKSGSGLGTRLIKGKDYIWGKPEILFSSEYEYG